MCPTAPPGTLVERRVITRPNGVRKAACTLVVASVDLAAEPLCDRLYCQRSDTGTRIKEAQIGLFARTSCRRRKANQLRVLLAPCLRAD